MKLVIQRVCSASVTIAGAVFSEIEKGLLVLIGISQEDTESDISYLVNKLIQMRIFSDENGLMNLSVKDIGGSILLVSQFTLLAQTKKGNRPSFIEAAKSDMAIPLYDLFCEKVKEHSDLNIQTGVFGADMQIQLINDGPVTILIDSKEK